MKTIEWYTYADGNATVHEAALGGGWRAWIREHDGLFRLRLSVIGIALEASLPFHLLDAAKDAALLFNDSGALPVLDGLVEPVLELRAKGKPT